MATINLRCVDFCYLKAVIMNFRHLLTPTCRRIVYEEDHGRQRGTIRRIYLYFWYYHHNIFWSFLPCDCEIFRQSHYTIVITILQLRLKSLKNFCEGNHNLVKLQAVRL